MKKNAMKFLVSLILVLAMLAPYTLVASAATTSGNFTYTVANNQATITKVATSVSGELTIPATLGGKPVTLLGQGALTGCTKITKITFASSDTKIYDDTATIPLGVTIRGYTGSLAQKYAIKYARAFNEIYTEGLAFESMGEEGLTYKVTGYVGTEVNVVIPRTHNGYPVTHYSIGITLGDANEPIVLPGESFEDEFIKQITFYSPTIVIPDDVNAISDGIVICGYVNSTAHQYAKKYAKQFVAIGEDPYTDGLEREISNDGETSSITNYTGSSSKVEIPRTHDGIPVTNFTADTFGVGETGEFEDGTLVLPEDGFAAASIDQITFYSKTIVIEDNPETIPEYTKIYGYVGSTAEKYADKYDRTFIILPEINSASVALGSDVTVNYMIYLDPTQKGTQMRFTTNDQDGKTTVTTVSGVATGTANRYKFSFTGINPQMMGDNIYAELVLNGNVINEKITYSVKDYCFNMKAKVDEKSITGFTDAKYAALGTLIADLLEYGAAAQIYEEYREDALVNEGMTGASKFVSMGSEYKQEADVKYDTANCFTEATVILNNAVKFRLTFIAKDISKVKIAIGGKTYTQADFTKFVKENKTYYYVDCPSIYATQFEARYKAIFYVNNNVSHILPYRVSNYLYEYQDETLVQRIRNYGLSAVNYMNVMK